MESKRMKIEYRLKRKVETNEWIVAAYVDGKFDDDKSYYTDDKQDAIDTMADLKKRGAKNESFELELPASYRGPKKQYGTVTIKAGTYAGKTVYAYVDDQGLLYYLSSDTGTTVPFGHSKDYPLSKRRVESKEAKEIVDRLLDEATDDAPTYRTFTRAATGWEEFSKAEKEYVDSGLTRKEAYEACQNFNKNRTEADKARGLKMEFESE
jgi:hypothetical protein